MEKTVTIIPSKINTDTRLPIGAVNKKKVAAYARVSTDSDEQYTSYDAQIKYYSNYIKQKAEWKYVDVYSDEGITGTNTKKREGFNRMIQDALAGKIDMIITKSISRFTRNTLDAINYIRKLKAKGVEIFFEKENVNTMDSTGELMLTILASMAQEESRSISQNVTMGKRWRVNEGAVSFAYASFLGYKKEGDKIVIDEPEAEIVKFIYSSFLAKGWTFSRIAEYLNVNNVPTPSKKGKRWTVNNISSILTNEKYKGDALLQKYYTVDFLEHKVAKNTGQVPQAYVENNHQAIIDREDWEMVQAEIARRSKFKYSYSANSIFSSKLKCECCGNFYGRKVWHKGSPYEKLIYQCNDKYNKEHETCTTPHLFEESIKEKFLDAYNEVMRNKLTVIEDTKEVLNLLVDTTKVDEEITALNSEIEVVSNLVTKLVNENSTRVQNQEEYTKKYNALSKRYEEAKQQLEEKNKEKSDKKAKSKALNSLIAKMEELDSSLLEWSDDIWMLFVDYGIVHKDGMITFKFKNGLEIRK